MARMTFHDEYFGDFAPEPRSELLELAREYETRTEAYDRTVCTGPIRDGAILPATHHELALVNRHALQVLRELEARSGDPKGLRDAIRAIAWRG